MTKDITVEQVDREAANPVAIKVMIGELSHEDLHEAFARHRHTSTLQAQEQIKVLREALAKIGGGMLEERAPHRAGTMARIARQALEATNG